jgi:hypothetical protein
MMDYKTASVIDVNYRRDYGYPLRTIYNLDENE